MKATSFETFTVGKQRFSCQIDHRTGTQCIA